jgi:hypothetical protein
MADHVAFYVHRETGAEIEAFEFRSGVHRPAWLPPPWHDEENRLCWATCDKSILRASPGHLIARHHDGALSVYDPDLFELQYRRKDAQPQVVAATTKITDWAAATAQAGQEAREVKHSKIDQLRAALNSALELHKALEEAPAEVRRRLELEAPGLVEKILQDLPLMIQEFEEMLREIDAGRSESTHRERP